LLGLLTITKHEYAPFKLIPALIPGIRNCDIACGMLLFAINSFIHLVWLRIEPYLFNDRTH
jgi:hypothetical protein